MSGNASDDDLLERLAAGDEEAFADLYRRRQAGIYRFALHMSGSAEVAEDVTQDVFLHLAREAGSFDPRRGAPMAWLFGIARKKVLQHLGRNGASAPMNGENESAALDDPLSDLTRKEAIASVRRAVLSLPEHYREVVVLCELQEMDYAEAAALLGCAVGTVRSRLHRARALLLDKLRPRRGVTHEVSGV